MPQFEIEVNFEIAAAHALRNIEGPCSNVHGHNWLITLYALSSDTDENGFALDFKYLKEVGRIILKRIDHRDLNALEPFTTINPTAENLAKWLFDECQALLMSRLLKEKDFQSRDPLPRLSRVRVRETNRCAVTYSPNTLNPSTL